MDIKVVIISNKCNHGSCTFRVLDTLQYFCSCGIILKFQTSCQHLTLGIMYTYLCCDDIVFAFLDSVQPVHARSVLGLPNSVLCIHSSAGLWERPEGKAGQTLMGTLK